MTSHAPVGQKRAGEPYGRHLESMTLTSYQKIRLRQSMRIYLKNNPDKFHLGPIWNDGALGFLKSVATTKRTRKTTR